MNPGADLYYESLDLLLPHVRRPEDDARAFALNAQAAASGFPDAVLAAGWLYLNGVGVARDLAQAERWYRRSARRGEPRAMYSLGYMAYEAQAFDTARRWFERASQAGHARSLYWLGKLAWRGHGDRQDRRAAFALFHRAARAHDPEALRVLRFLSRRGRTSNPTIERMPTGGVVGPASSARPRQESLRGLHPSDEPSPSIILNPWLYP